MTRAPDSRAISPVRSVLPESTTTISSTSEAMLFRQRGRLRSSFSVMMQAEIFMAGGWARSFSGQELFARRDGQGRRDAGHAAEIERAFAQEAGAARDVMPQHPGARAERDQSSAYRAQRAARSAAISKVK